MKGFANEGLCQRRSLGVPADLVEVPRSSSRILATCLEPTYFVQVLIGLCLANSVPHAPPLPCVLPHSLEQVAAQTIIAIPYEEQEEVIGPHGRSYVRSVARALPVAILRPVVGASEALSCTLLGFRNFVSPVIRKEEEGKWG